jgi:hypothetical protein
MNCMVTRIHRIYRASLTSAPKLLYLDGILLLRYYQILRIEYLRYKVLLNVPFFLCTLQLLLIQYQ